MIPMNYHFQNIRPLSPYKNSLLNGFSSKNTIKQNSNSTNSNTTILKSNNTNKSSNQKSNSGSSIVNIPSISET